MEQFLGEGKALKSAIKPQDLNGGASSARIAVKDLHRIAVVCHLADGPASVLRLELFQSDAASAGNEKALEISNKYFHKFGAATNFTVVEPSVAADLYDLAAISGTDEAVYVFEILPEDLDVNGEFNHISANLVGDAGRIASVMFIGEPKNKPASEIEL